MSKGYLPALAALASLMAGSAAHADAASEASASALFDRIKASPTRLRIFLQAMPKGGDLHNHLDGSPYAEDYLRWAAKDGFCADDAGTSLLPPPCAGRKMVAELSEKEPFAFAKLVDGLSTRGLQKGVGRNDTSGHTQFFQSFDRFEPIVRVETAKTLAAVLRLAAGDRVSYVELDHDPYAMIAHILAAADVPLDASGLGAQYDREIGAIPAILGKARAELDRDEAEVRRSLGCAGANADPSCAVAVHYLAWGFRDLPPAQVFRSLILAFAMADSDPRFVGVNIVQPEDWPIALRDYDLHMAMLRFLEAKYPRVHRSLHAGELAFGLVPPSAMRDHIRKAIDAGAERIGHGTDIAYEDDAIATMRRMARDGIAVEINLTSNDVILGVKGGDHPLDLYRRLGVPVVLSTDDEGILRTDMTNEYARAATEHGLLYSDLKMAARTSLDRAFIPGASLWKKGRIGSPVEPCARSLSDSLCQDFVAGSEKARLQVDLERQFDRFEQTESAMPSKLLATADIGAGDHFSSGGGFSLQ